MHAVIIDMKYHIASMVAVFLALGVGILVGSGMVGDSVLIEQQERIIDRLELDFAELRTSRDDLYARLALAERLLAASFRFEDEACSKLASGKLSGKHIAVIVSGDGMAPDDVDRACRVVENAGGIVASVTYVHKRLEPVSSVEAKELGLACGIAATSPQAVRQASAEALARCSAFGEVSPCVSALATLGYVTLDRDAPGRADAVIVAGGSQDPAADAMHVDIPIVRALRKMGAAAIGIEPADVRISYIKDYKREGIATVDCADTPLGRLSLVYALAGCWGHFGIKGTAERPVPDVFPE